MKLPGRLCTVPGSRRCQRHANAIEVARFLRLVLRRNGIDNRGGRLISVVNCIVNDDAQAGRVWLNACWDGTE